MIVLQTLAGRGILFPGDVESADPAHAGGKAAGLARLRDAGCDVPPWFVVTPDWNGDENAIREALTRLEADDEHRAAPAYHDDAAKHRAVPQCHPEPVEGCAAAVTFAVRSSAVAEDGANASYAGQFASLLFVPRDGVAGAIRRVRASATSESVRAYAGAAAEIAMAVVVQRMVDGEASGVAFGIDPVDGSDVVVVTAAYGLASGVVGGDLVTDAWRVARDGTVAERAIVEKDRMHVRAPGAGTLAVAIDPALRRQPVLDDGAVLAVASLARRIANACGGPQDVEFTFAAGRLWALQARPVTAVAAATVAIWDDSNIAESYGGVAGALTYSFARHAYAGAYRSFFRLAGVSRDRIDANAETFDGLVGRIEGRMMYDLVRWYRMLALLPGYRLNRTLMEEMMGVREAMPAEIADAIARDCRRGKLRDAAMLARTAVSLTVTAARLPGDVVQFHADVEAALGGGPDLDRAPLVELTREYRRLERALLDRWNVPIANDFFVMLAFGLLKRAAASWCGDASLGPALLAASGGMMSAEPARAVQRLAALDAAGDRETFTRELAAYVAKFGDRCESELKLESPTLHDDPRPLLEAIARLRTAPAVDARSAGDAVSLPEASRPADASALAGGSHASVEMRRDAERRVREALRGDPLRAFAFARLVAWARARIVARENLRFERTRVFGRVRRIFVAMGRILAKRGVLDDARDVFDLTTDELLGYVEGNSASRELRALAAVRRAESARYAAAPPPPNRFATRDLPVAPLFVAAGTGPEVETADTAVAYDAVRTGTPCCPGIVRARVRVVRDPRETLRCGEILVAERTDPSWVVLFPAAAAILVERGSQLSHAAIVSREMGIPSVVAVRGLMSWLHDGDLVELDGTTGAVRRLDEAPAGRLEEAS
ncbi:MAG: pyruvate phosphate dikinase PEP/pyruvate-binding protein [Candidatus Eremiobacteraeota bacterium]|nr:pyruvate phosphate dikinase PEP/pyruvate-binding protein [Candidatus Eremiobacteraeota bacterium]